MFIRIIGANPWFYAECEHALCHPVLGRGHPCMCLEETDEMLGVLKTELQTDLVDAQVALVQQLLGGGEEVVGNEILGSLAGLHFDQGAEVAGREAALVGKIGHSGQSLTAGLCLDIVGQHPLKPPHYVVVDLFARHKLAVVEAKTIVEQQLDVRHNQVAAVLVDGAVQLLRNHVQYIAEYINLSGRQMQSLVAGIGEELILVDVSSQRTSSQQVGMEHECRPLGKWHSGHRLHMHGLTGCKGGDGHLVEVIFRSAIRELAPLVLFQKEGIEAIFHQTLLNLLGLVVADHAHQRVKRLETVLLIKPLYCI